jgi:hypothetical protein
MAQRRRRFFRHRTLVGLETVLLVGVAQQLFQAWVVAHLQSNAAKVLFTMAGVVGLFGGLFVAIQMVMHLGVDKSHQMVRSMPIRFPLVLAHAVLLVAIFYLYAWAGGLPVWPMAAAAR